MTSDLDQSRMDRITRSGPRPLSVRRGLALFDSATARAEPLLVLTGGIPDGPRAPGPAPAILRGLLTGVRRMVATSQATSDSRSLIRRLPEHSRAGQQQLLQDLVVARAATLLGHDSSDAIDPGRNFLELGVDSLVAIELRNHLSEMVGQSLPASVVFDAGTPAQLALWLHTEVAGEVNVAAPQANDTLEKLFLSAIEGGKGWEAQAMLTAVAATRPSFTSTAECTDPPAPITLSEGPAPLRLICFPTPVATGGPHHYARIAGHFRGRRHVCSLPLYGLAQGEDLPATPDVAVQFLAESALLASEGHPFALVGYSAGGTLAHHVASVMEQTCDIRPKGVVLLDTLNSEDARKYAATRGGFYRQELDAAPVRLDSARLSGGAHWLKMALDFVESPVTAQTLLVRAGILPDGSEVDPAQPPPVPATAVVTVPGDHAAIVHDDTVVPQAIEDWLFGIETGAVASSDRTIDDELGRRGRLDR